MSTCKTVVIHQPDFMPYLGFFHRFLSANLYIVLDHVQFVTNSSKSWMHRDKIKTAHGEDWLTLSVKKAARGTPINQIELSTETDYKTANLNLIRANYRHAPYYGEIMPHVEKLYDNLPTLLVDFNMRSIDMLLELLGICIPKVFSSSLTPQGSKNAMLIDLLHKVGATDYLSGVGARAYMDVAAFETAGIRVIWQEFAHPVYLQQHGEFIPFLSTLDALFNCGIIGTQKLLKGAL